MSINVSNCINCGNVDDEDTTTLSLGGTLRNWIGAIIGYTKNDIQTKNCLGIGKETLVECSDEQIKGVLSNEFKKDEGNKNEGLPILGWE